MAGFYPSLPRAPYLELHRKHLACGADAPDKFCHEWTGDVRLFTRDFAPGERIGTFSCCVVDAMASVNERVSLDCTFDYSATTLRFWDELFEPDGDFKDKVAKRINAIGVWNPNILILERLLILPRYRGHGYGLAALAGIIEAFRTGVGVVAMQPYPLQFEAPPIREDERAEFERYGLGDFKSSLPASRARLRKYYGRLGFRHVPRTNMMVRSPDLPLPEEDELLGFASGVR
jgi:GNAT superfamily N-acetyltransferase